MNDEGGFGSICTGDQGTAKAETGSSEKLGMDCRSFFRWDRPSALEDRPTKSPSLGLTIEHNDKDVPVIKWQLDDIRDLLLFSQHTEATKRHYKGYRACTRRYASHSTPL